MLKEFENARSITDKINSLFNNALMVLRNFFKLCYIIVRM